jgi:hypothetical protein
MRITILAMLFCLIAKATVAEDVATPTERM